MIRYISDLKRRYDHIKIVNDEVEEYQPAMIIYKPDMLGISFAITIDAIWKYIEPRDNMEPETIRLDVEEFNKILLRNQKAQIAVKRGEKASDIVKARIVEDGLCISFALALNKTLMIMYCTGYNLAKCLHIFGIDPQPQAAIQLLLWIQDGLGDLKDMKDALPENTGAAGEVTLFIDGQKITKDVTLNETDVIMGE